MVRRLTLLALMAMTITICNCSDIAFASILGYPTLYSPHNGAYVDGSEITFSWQSMYGTCATTLSVCTDQYCNNVLKYDNGNNLTSLTEYLNLTNNGTKYYWQVHDNCIDDTGLYFYVSYIWNFTTYDSVNNVTITSTPASPVIEGHQVTLTAQGQGAPLNDYLYRFVEDSYVNGVYSSSRELQAPSATSSCTWTAPAYQANETYMLHVEAGTSSFESYHGSFSWDHIAWSPAYNVLPSSTPVITTTSLPEAMEGAPYSTNALAATGGYPPYTWSNINNGQSTTYVFPGISIDPNTGVISGTPTSWNDLLRLEIQVKDSRDLTATKFLSFPVYPPLSITTSFFPNVIFGTVYPTKTLAASGGKPPYTGWSISSGSLPTGLSLDPSTGTISGIPIGLGNFPFSVKVSDSLNATIEKSFYIYVYPPISIGTGSLPSGTVGSPYTQAMTATGGAGAYCWSMYSGSLPAGLTLSSSGVINGTPLTASSYPFTVQVGSDCQNPAAIDRRPYTIVVYTPLSITTSSLPSGAAGSAYNPTTLSATGGNGSYTWSLSPGSSLPAGLTLSPAGVISGTPQNGGSYTFTVQVSDTQSPTPATKSSTFTIAVAYLPLQITTDALSSGTSGSDYNQTLTATGGKTPYTWSIPSGSLTAGLSLDPTTGVISGIPADIGSFSVTVQVTDAQSSPAITTQNYSFNITNGIMQRCTEYGSETSTSVCTNSTTNVINGVVAHDQELFGTKGAAYGAAIELFYKSMPSYNGPLGTGWSHSYNIFLTVNGDGSVVMQDGSVSKSFYAKSGSSYVSPPGDYSTLVKNADNSYTITYRDGHRMNFRTDGKIVSLVDRFNNTISFNYTGSDLTGITDQAQRTTTIIYDQTTTPHRIQSITDPNSKVYDFAYQGSSLYRVTNPAADPTVSTVRGYWEYQYDAAGYLKSKRDPNGNTGQYTYYADHRMWIATDPEGQTRTIVYPSATGTLRTSTLTEKDHGLWGYTYDAQAGVLKLKTDPNGKTINYTYYPNGNLKSKTEPKDGAVRLTTFYTYDSYGKLLTQTNPADLNGYNPAIDPETVTDPTTLASLSPPVIPAIRYGYDNSNYDRITSVSDERVTPFLTTTLVYTTENGGEVATATATPGNYVTVTKKNPNGTVSQSIDANQKSTTFTYYPDTTANRTAGIVGLLWTATDPAGIVTTITSYDKSGNPLEVTVKDTAGTVRLTSSQQHDALNRLKQLTKTAATLPNIVTTYGYDMVGNLNSLIDAETRETKYEYNYNRRVKKTTDAKQNDTVFKYSGSEGNGVDKLVGVYDANVTKNTPLDSQPHTAFSYDKVGRLEYETDQLGKKMHYTYYDNGQLKEKYDATAATPGTLLATYLYNNLGQLTDKTFTDGTSEHYIYFPDGKLQTATNQNISYTYSYNDDGRLHTVTDTTNNRVISYDLYDGMGQRKQVTILKGAGADERVISYDYDAANRPWKITSTAGTFTYAYDNLGRRDTLTYPNNTLADWDFDDLNRLTAITNKVTGGAPFAAFNYTAYDKVGNRKNVTGNKNEAYGYDELYRLLTVTATQPEAFNCDAVGNRQNGPGATDTAYVPNAANQMIQGRKLGYGYDNFGNQTTKTVPSATDKSWVQTWDYQNRLVKVEKIKGTERRTVTFTYDPLGRRIGKQMTTVIDGVTKTQTWSYVYDGDSIAVEIYTDENNATTKTFYAQGPGTDEHLALERNGQFYYYHADGLGSIASITDAAHNVVQSYEYDSYGMLTPANSFRNSYAYTGREWDPEAGLYYYRARYYDPMEGRFVSKDPIGFDGGINIYSYVQSNPFNFVDPFGLAPLTYEQGVELAKIFESWLNTPYKMLGAASRKGKDGGGDCSGITYKGYKEAGLKYDYMQAVEFKDLENHPNFVKVDTPQPGDIGYVYTGFNHVVVYAGDGYYYTASSKAKKFIKTDYYDGKVTTFYRYNITE